MEPKTKTCSPWWFCFDRCPNGDFPSQKGDSPWANSDCQGQYMSTTDLWLTSVWSIGWGDTGRSSARAEQELASDTKRNAGTRLPWFNSPFCPEGHFRFPSYSSEPSESDLSAMSAGPVQTALSVILCLACRHVQDSDFWSEKAWLDPAGQVSVFAVCPDLSVCANDNQATSWLSLATTFNSPQNACGQNTPSFDHV